MLKPAGHPKEAKLLVRVQCGILMAMLLMELALLVLDFAVHSCWVREYEGLESEKEAVLRKRRRMARVQGEEIIAIASKVAEPKSNTKDFDEKNLKRSKYGQWVKTDFEG